MVLTSARDFKVLALFSVYHGCWRWPNYEPRGSFGDESCSRKRSAEICRRNRRSTRSVCKSKWARSTRSVVRLQKEMSSLNSISRAAAKANELAQLDQSRRCMNNWAIPYYVLSTFCDIVTSCLLSTKLKNKSAHITVALLIFCQRIAIEWMSY